MISVSGKKWEQKKNNKNLIEKLKQDYDFSEVLSKLIISRKFDNDEINSIYNDLTLNNIFLGIGGGPEGVLAASALDTYGCHFQGRFIFDNDKDISEAKKMGITDLNKKYELNEIVKGDSIFCATGITTSDVLSSIEINDNHYVSETLVTHKSSNFKKIIKRTDLIKE